ncbi:MAG: transcription termination/antitermination protein NusG [Mycoplasmataceae bacterium]|nr:transcription termination/antitermination protein NusG [Mycoplasmataceae bacterium]
MANIPAQWFIITTIRGKEDSIISALNDKIRNFNYSSYIEEIKVLKTKEVTKKIYNRDDPNIPAKINNSKTVKWTILSDGRYEKEQTRIANKYPGYIFIKMVMEKNVWYAIRNLPGILGFVGSSGKGAQPIPISIEEYEKISGKSQTEEIVEKVKEDKTETLKFKKGMSVVVLSENMKDTVGTIKNIDYENNLVTLLVDILGRKTELATTIDQIKLAD